MESTPTTEPRRSYRIPAGIAIALATGRPEIAGMLFNTDAPPTAEQMQELNAYLVDLVGQIQTERGIVSTMWHAIHENSLQLRGALARSERLEAAMLAMQQGAGPEAVRDALRNPKSRYDKGDDAS